MRAEKHKQPKIETKYRLVILDPDGKECKVTDLSVTDSFAIFEKADKIADEALSRYNDLMDFDET